jgi:hypothetical protein
MPWPFFSKWGLLQGLINDQEVLYRSMSAGVGLLSVYARGHGQENPSRKRETMT